MGSAASRRPFELVIFSESSAKTETKESSLAAFVSKILKNGPMYADNSLALSSDEAIYLMLCVTKSVERSVLSSAIKMEDIKISGSQLPKSSREIEINSVGEVTDPVQSLAIIFYNIAICCEPEKQYSIQTADSKDTATMLEIISSIKKIPIDIFLLMREIFNSEPTKRPKLEEVEKRLVKINAYLPLLY